MNPLVYIGLGLAVFVAIALTILGLRGRFGTTRQRGRFELHELVRSSEVPRTAVRRTIATCRGHSLNRSAVYGAGALWLTDDEIGFVLHTPRRHLRLPRSSITSAVATSSYHRVGIDEVSDTDDFLVIGFDASEGPSTVAFQLPEAKVWAGDIERVSA